MVVHTGDRPYSCSKCDKSFSVSSYLKKHMRFHTGSDCGRSFSNSGNLNKHKNTHTCEKSFSTSGKLKRHQGVHKAEAETEETPKELKAINVECKNKEDPRPSIGSVLSELEEMLESMVAE